MSSALYFTGYQNLRGDTRIQDFEQGTSRARMLARLRKLSENCARSLYLVAIAARRIHMGQQRCRRLIPVPVP